ncbi:hypothetical protein ACV56Z_03470 [Staphylococcus aureus]
MMIITLDIIVEVMGGIEPTVDWLRTALKNKKHVITANKVEQYV